MHRENKTLFAALGVLFGMFSLWVPEHFGPVQHLIMPFLLPGIFIGMGIAGNVHRLASGWWQSETLSFTSLSVSEPDLWSPSWGEANHGPVAFTPREAALPCCLTTG